MMPVPARTKVRAMAIPLLRFGLLGAARIAPLALVRPARAVEGIVLEAVAARDGARARKFAAKHGFARVLDSYAALIADPAIDAIYNPLPNSLHAEWTIRALEAGKHVLCEKPLASNAAESERMAEAAKRSGRVLMEAFHYRFHPLMARVLGILASGEIGQVRRIETAMCIPLPLPNDIRYRLELSGGATMDVGCYAIHMLRTVAGEEPEVVSARAKLSSPGVDRAMEAEFRFASGATGRIECSLFSRRLLKLGIVVHGEKGELRVLNATIPQLFHRLRVKSERGERSEQVPSEATYVHQLRAFKSVVCEGTQPLIPLHDSVANMRVIDAVYRAAGLPLRGMG